MLQAILLAVFAALLGIALCFYGYRFFLVFLPIWGFFGGFWVGAEATQLVLGGGFLATTTSWVIGLITGIFVAIFSYMFFELGVMLVAAAIGFAVGAGTLAAIGIEASLILLAAGLIMAAVVAFVTLRYKIHKYVVMLLTALGGANAIILSALLLIGRVTPPELAASGNIIQPVLQDSILWLVFWLVIAVVGLNNQVRKSGDFNFSKENYREIWG
jgi:hypothetical protein